MDEGSGSATLPTAPNPLRSSDRAAHGELRLASHLAHFRLESRLGEGGLGVVYRAFDEKLKRPVALKVLTRGSTGSSSTSSLARSTRLMEEARAAAALNHPCIAAIYDLVLDEQVPFLVMELVEGHTLRAEMQRGPLPPATALRYAREIASGLARAHKNGIVHRDLKPENVMITPEGGAKILDFGLAREVVATEDDDASASHPETTGVVGTPSYMSPEQAAGRRVDARSDVFSFGIVLHEMLVGERPFAPREKGAVATWERLPKRSAIASRVVDRCLELDVAKRFVDGGDLVSALAEVDHARRRTPWRALGLAAMLTALGVGGYVFVSRRGVVRAVSQPVASASVSASTSATSSAPAPAASKSGAAAVTVDAPPRPIDAQPVVSAAPPPTIVSKRKPAPPSSASVVGTPTVEIQGPMVTDL